MVSAQSSPLPALFPLSTPVSPPPPTIPSFSFLPLALAVLHRLLCSAAAVLGPSTSLGDFFEARFVPWWSPSVCPRRIPIHRTAAPFRRTGSRLEHSLLSPVSDPDPPDCSRSVHPPAWWLRLCTGFQVKPDLGEVRRLSSFCRAGIPSHQMDRAVLQAQAAKPSRAGLLLQTMRPNCYPETLLGWLQLLCRWKMGWPQLLCIRKMDWSHLLCRWNMSVRAQSIGPFAYA